MTQLTPCVVFFTCMALVPFAWAAQADSPVPEGRCIELPRSPFRYVIYYNDVHDPKEEWAERNVGVLLDERAFSEETLKQLFALLSERYPSPQRLVVDVDTSLDTARTPEEQEGPAVCGACENPSHRQHHWALYMRFEDDEIFRYNPNPPDRDMKTVVLRGKDPTDPE